jgi:hypothetical protein
MSGAGAARTFTLPPATVSGAMYRFVVGAVNTSSYVIAAPGTDELRGQVIMATDNAADAVIAFEITGTHDKLTLNGTSTGGAHVGNWVELQDFATGLWFVRGQLSGTGSEATPASAT